MSKKKVASVARQFQEAIGILLVFNARILCLPITKLDLNLTLTYNHSRSTNREPKQRQFYINSNLCIL